MSPKKTDREWAAYVRVSKVMGRTEETGYVSPTQQEAKVCAALKAQYEVAPTRIFKDEDRTGTDANRPDFQEMLAWVEEDPKRRGFAVMDGSRLFRDAELFLTTVKRLERLGAEYLSAHLLLDAKTPEGALMRTLDAAINEFFSANIGRRWRMVLEDRAKSGKHPTGRKIYGYRKEPDPASPKKTVLVPDEDGGTAEVVRRLYRLYNGGTGLREIARIFNEEGLKSPGGSTWGISTVKRTLENEAYVGRLVFKGEVVNGEDGKPLPTQWEPLISQAAWDTFQSEKARRAKKPKKVATPKWTLGGGLSRCGKCGAPLTVNSLASPRGMVMCGNYRAGRGCEGVFMLRYRFDGQFALMLHLYWQDEAAKAASAKHDEQAEQIREEAEAEVRACEDRQEVVKTARTRLAKQNAEGLITDEDLAEGLREYAAESAALTERLSAARDRLTAAASVGDSYRALLSDFSDGVDTQALAEAVHSGTKSMSVAEWSRALSRVVASVTLHDDRVVFQPVVGEAREVRRERKAGRRRKPVAKRTEWEQPVEPNSIASGADGGSA